MSKTDQENALATLPDEPENKSIETSVPQQEEPRKSSAGRIVKRVLVFFLRLFLFLAFLAALAAGAYFGLPILYERYVRPVENHTSQLTKLDDRQTLSESQIAAMQTHLATLEAAQNNQAGSISDMDSRLQALEGEITAHTQTLETLDTLQASLATGIEANSAELENQINLFKSLEFLSRARLFLYQSNYGLARQDVQAARDLLEALQVDAPEFKTEELAETIFRLDLVLKNLPAFPVVASDDLDIAWQILLQGIPPLPEETSTPEPATEAPATEPTPTRELTPTPTP